MGNGAKNLLYAVALTSLAGSVAGLMFTIRCLVFILFFVLFEFVIIAIIGEGLEGEWLLASLVAAQFGYVGGLFVRGALEQSGFLFPGARARKP